MACFEGGNSTWHVFLHAIALVGEFAFLPLIFSLGSSLE